MASLGGFINVDWSIAFYDKNSNLMNASTQLSDSSSYTFDYTSTVNNFTGNPGYTSVIDVSSNVVAGKNSTTIATTGTLENIYVYDNSGQNVYYIDSSNVKWNLAVTLSNQTKVTGTVFNSDTQGTFTYNESTTTWYGLSNDGLKKNYDIYLLSNSDKETFVKIYDSAASDFNPLTTSTTSSANAYPIKIYERKYKTVTQSTPPPGGSKNYCVDGLTAQALFYNGYMLPLSGFDSSSGYVTSTPTSNPANNDQFSSSVCTLGTLDVAAPVQLPSNLSNGKNIFTNSTTNVVYDTTYSYYSWFAANCATNSNAAKLAGILPLQPNGDVSFITAGYIILNSTLPA
jgi:hypothetical protein